MSDRPANAVSQTPTPSGKKPRNPVERVIVWGGIAVMLGVLFLRPSGIFGSAEAARLREY